MCCSQIEVSEARKIEVLYPGLIVCDYPVIVKVLKINSLIDAFLRDSEVLHRSI